MKQVLTMIEAYGASKAEGETAQAQAQLEAIQQALADNGNAQFEVFWGELPGQFAKLGAMPPDVVKKMCELVWWESRQTLVEGSAHRRVTPRFLGRDNAIQTRP